MASLEETKREVAKLRAEKEVREDFQKRNAEKKELERERSRLKHPTLYRIGSGLRSGASAIGSGARRKPQSSTPVRRVVRRAPVRRRVPIRRAPIRRRTVRRRAPVRRAPIRRRTYAKRRKTTTRTVRKAPKEKSYGYQPMGISDFV